MRSLEAACLGLSINDIFSYFLLLWTDLSKSQPTNLPLKVVDSRSDFSLLRDAMLSLAFTGELADTRSIFI